jgi:hypothetical protein
LLSENLNNLIDIGAIYLGNGALNFEVSDLIDFQRWKNLKSGRVFNVPSCLKCTGFDSGLSSWAKLFADNRLLKRLINHFTNDFLTNAAAKTLLHDLHRHFARPEPWEPNIACRLTETLRNRTIDPIGRDTNGKSPL